MGLGQEREVMWDVWQKRGIDGRRLVGVVMASFKWGAVIEIQAGG